ncbi:MAG: T9SS type A sorting domain-containing protein [Bacteroidales bacterium]|nr:T9SS type A sorting domain-containing protein [Bacteroidales bacterium]
MKKIIILITVAIIAVNVMGQNPNVDSLNFREYEDLYYLPDAMMTKCITLDASNTTGSLVMDMYNGFYKLTSFTFFDKLGQTFIMDVAQLYDVNDTLEITGVSVFLFKVQYGSMFPFVGIADTGFNFITKVPVPSYHNDPDKLTPFCRYRELFFDKPIKVSGKFYVMYDNPKPLPGYNWDVSLPISTYRYHANGAAINKNMPYNNCDSDTLFRLTARQFYTNLAGTQIDYENSNPDWTDYSNLGTAFMFPILKEPITQTEIDEESATVLYGNSYQVTDTIERNDSTILRTATIVCDTSLSADTIVHLYMHNTNHKDSIIKGDTTIICDTLNIQYTYVTNSLNNPTLERFTSVFPNPADKELNVLCSYKIKSIEIYDERGVIVEKINKVNSYSRVIDIQKYNKGNYVLKVITNSGSVNKKFVVQ